MAASARGRCPGINGAGALPPPPPPTFLWAFVLFRGRGSRAGRGEGRANLNPSRSPAEPQLPGEAAAPSPRRRPRSWGTAPAPHRPAPPRRPRASPAPPPPPEPQPEPTWSGARALPACASPAARLGARGGERRRDGGTEGTEGGGPGWRRSGEADNQLLPGERGRRCGARHSRLPGGAGEAEGGERGPAAGGGGGGGGGGRGAGPRGAGAPGRARRGARGAAPGRAHCGGPGRALPPGGRDNVQGRAPAGERRECTARLGTARHRCDCTPPGLPRQGTAPGVRRARLGSPRPCPAAPAQLGPGAVGWRTARPRERDPGIGAGSSPPPGCGRGGHTVPRPHVGCILLFHTHPLLAPVGEQRESTHSVSNTALRRAQPLFCSCSWGCPVGQCLLTSSWTSHLSVPPSPACSVPPVLDGYKGNFDEISPAVGPSPPPRMGTAHPWLLLAGAHVQLPCALTTALLGGEGQVALC